MTHLHYNPVFFSKAKVTFLCFLVCTAPVALNGTGNPIKVSLGPLCDITVDVPNDFHLCEEDDIELCANVFSPTTQFEVEWLEDGDFISDDFCEEVTITENTEFTFRATYTDDVNLIENGDFENGDDGSFDTDYIIGMGNCFHSAGFLTCEGYYQVMDNPNDGLPAAFAACGDNTSGSGEMMVVNGALGLQEIWCQDVCLDPDASYILGAFGTSVHPDSPAELQFSIDGNLIGDILELSSSTCVWDEFLAEFFADGESQVEICITNQNTEMQGNDFAIDDISLYQICTAEESFMVTVSEIELNIADPAMLTCQTSTVPVEVSISSAEDIGSIAWETLDGQIIGADDDEVVLAGAEGTYTVTVTDVEGCLSTAVAVVLGSINIPTLSIAGNTTLNCDSTSVVLTAASNLPNPTFTWLDSLGNTLSVAPSFTTTKEGLIEVIVSNGSGGCGNIDSVLITIDTSAVEFDLIKSNDLTCNLSDVELTTSVPQDSVLWRSNTSSIISETNDTIIVSQAGEYYAEAINPNGCSHIDTVIVSGLVPSFQYAIDADTEIDCSDPTADVFIDYDLNTYNFSWTGTSASLGSDNPVELSDEGTYTFQLIDNNGCIKEDSVTITENIFVPEIFTNANTITCLNPTSILEISWLENIVWFNEVTWILPDGSVQQDDTSFSTSQPGWVKFSAELISNGCTIEDSILVEASNDFPTVSIMGDTLNCYTSQVLITTEASPDVTDYSWTLPDLRTSTATTLFVDLAGTYVLQVTNASGCSSTAEYQLIEDIDLPAVSVQNSATINCIDTMAQINASVTGSYQEVIWTGPGLMIDSLTLETQMEGDYYLEVVGMNGCISRDTATVLVDTIPTDGYVLAPALELSCALTSFTPDLTEDQNDLRTFTWETPGGNLVDHDDLVITEPGDYSLTIVGANGCPAIELYTVSQAIDLPVFESAATELSCAVDSVIVTVSSTANDLTYQYLDPLTDDVLGMGEEFIAQGLEAIKIVVTDNNGCSAIEELIFNQDTVAPNFSVSALGLSCLTPSVQATVSTMSPLENMMIFDEAGNLVGDAEEFLTDAGLYYLSAASENGCITQNTFEVTIDTTTIDFTLEAGTLDCSNPITDIHILSADNIPAAGINHINGSYTNQIQNENIFADISEAGVYEIIVTNDNGCTSTETIEIFSDGSTIAFSVEADTITCSSSAATLEIITSDTYTDGFAMNVSTEEVFSDLDNLEVLLPGLYEVHLFSANGCESIETIEVIEIDDLPEIEIFETETLDCEGNGQIIDFQIRDGDKGPYIVTLDGLLVTDIQNNIPVMGTGRHDMTIEDTYGCKSDHLFFLDPIDPLNLNAPLEILIQEATDRDLLVNANKLVSELEVISWTPEQDLSCYDCLAPSFTGQATTSYNLYVKDSSGCEATLQIRFIIEEEPSKVYVPDIINPLTSGNDNRFTIFTSIAGVEEVKEIY